jgi:acyl-CoA thioesterase
MNRPDRIRSLLDKDRYAKNLGIDLVGVGDQTVTVSMPITDEHENFHGGTHGGAIFSVADCAFSLASNAYDDPAVAIDTHLAITAPTSSGDTLTAVAEEASRGRRLATYRVTVSRADGRVCGLFTGTVFIIAPE